MNIERRGRRALACMGLVLMVVFALWAAGVWH
jgi:hypothetical protein